MFAWINARNYIVIAICVALGFYVFGLLAGQNLTQLFLNFKVQAEAAGMSPTLTQLIFEPVRIALEANIIACIIVGAVWPLALLWLILMFLMFIYAVLVPGLGTAAGTIDGK